MRDSVTKEPRIRPRVASLPGMMVGAGLALAAATGNVRAQAPAGAPSSVRSLSDQVVERTRRQREFVALLGDKDTAIQETALQMALSDPDPIVQGMAISAYLKRFNALTPEVVLDTGSPVAQEDVPRLAFQDIKWSDDSKSFVGTYPSMCSFPTAVRGQLAGGKLAINFDGICLRSSMLSKDKSGLPGKGDALQGDPCQLTLAPDKQMKALEGNLHCVGMSAALNVQLPFGS